MSILFVYKIILFHLGELHADDANSVDTVLCQAQMVAFYTGKWLGWMCGWWWGVVGEQSKNSSKRVVQYILVRAREFTKMCM
jgi:hypothetical protein